MKLDPKLAEKYNQAAPRYTSYPPATFFHSGFGNEAFRKALVRSNLEDPRNISIYIHIPFCPQLCHFCGCTTETGFTKTFLERYIDVLVQEIQAVAKEISPNRELTQVHWGGGTPNSIQYRFIERITETIQQNFQFSDDYEMAIECNPAYFEPGHIEKLKAFGFNRVSMGVQDFNPKILEAINRKPTRFPISELVQKLKEEGFRGTNIDLVYGLPLQTPESWEQTLDKALALNADRVVTFSYAHVPSVIPRQRVLEKLKFPSTEEKANMFRSAYERFTEAGYEAIGMDHFSRPDDELAIALRTQKLHRNFQGYCTKSHTGQVYGFGASSISQLHSAYAQNEKNTAKYIERMEAEGMAVMRGYALSQQDKVVRQVINELMCNYFVDLEKIADQFQCSLLDVHRFVDYAPEELEEALKPFMEDGLMEIDGSRIQVYPRGHMVIRNIVVNFDPLNHQGKGQYSKTV